MSTREELEQFKPTKDFFVGIDSDGTVFDSMNIKHLKAFIPAALQVWDFGNAKEKFEAACKDINLYSKNRGINRFAGLLIAFETVPETHINPASLKTFVEKSPELSNAALEKYIKSNPDSFLQELYRWSLLADDLFEKHTEGLLPFDHVPETLSLMTEQADIMVVSSAVSKGLYKDWSYSGLDEYVALIAGQEVGNKKLQLKLATQGKYPAHHILMIGDAPSDGEAADGSGALFYPIVPGKEEESWLKLQQESLVRFFEGTYKGDYEDSLKTDFLGSLK